MVFYHLWNSAMQTITNVKEYDSVPAVLTFSIVVISILWAILRLMQSRKLLAKLPPGPRGLPIIGFLPFLSSNLHHQFADLSQKYGPIYKFWLANKLSIVVSSPALAREVVRDQDLIMANRDTTIAAKVITYGGFDIAFSQYGTYWRNARKLFSVHMLSNKNIETCYSHRKVEVRKAINYVYSKTGTPISIGELAYLTQINVIMTMIWGGTLDEEKRERVGIMFRRLTSDIMYFLGKPNISDVFPTIARFDFQGIEKQMKKLLHEANSLFDLVLDEHTKMVSRKEIKSDQKKDILQILLQLKQQNDSEMLINTTHIKAIFMDIVIGGTDTSSTTIEWVMTELLHNPIVMDKVQQELDSVIGTNNIVEESHLSKLKYLEAAVKETFRLHPPLPLLVPRQTRESCSVGGYTIPKEATVYVNVWAIQRDPEAWENPSQFLPERFLNENLKFDYEGNSFEFLPFGSGRRICAGLSLGQKMVMYVLASLLHSYDWRIPEGEELDFEETFGLVVRKSKPLLAIPSQRLANIDIYK